ncbi:MAG: Calx-beta domain-containing protein, partial [Microcystaceae cyanobacterium]
MALSSSEIRFEPPASASSDTLTPNSNQPVLIGSYNTGGDVRDVQIVSNIAYVADSGNDPTVEFSEAFYQVNEDEGNAFVVELLRTGNVRVESDVQIQLIGGTATQGYSGDYLIYDDTVHFAKGQSRQYLEIKLNNDRDIEDIETIKLAILSDENVSNYVLGNQHTTTVEILDSSPTVEFSQLSRQVNEDEGFTWVAEIIRTGDLSLSSRVQVKAVGGTATQGHDYEDYLLYNDTVHFSQGQSKQYVKLTLNHDDYVEDLETIELEIIRGEGDDNYVVGTQNKTFVDILNNDSSPQPDTPPTVTFSQPVYQINEQEGYDVLVAEITRTGDLSLRSEVQINVIGGTATDGTDYYLHSYQSEIYFSEGQSQGYVTIQL